MVSRVTKPHVQRVLPRESTLYRVGRDLAYRRMGEEQAEWIAGMSRPFRHEYGTPVAGLPLVAAEGLYHPVIMGGAFSSYDQIITALATAGRSQVLNYAKASFTTAANLPFTYFTAGGTPPAMAFGTALTGRTRDDTVTGAIPLTNASGGRTMHMLRCGVGSPTVALGTLVVFDRLAEYPFNGSVTGAQTFNTGSGVQIPSRDVNGSNAGDGCQMFIENIQATTTATGPTVTLTYTNQAGTGAKSTGALTVVGAAIIGRVVFPGAAITNWWIPLAAGDTGVQNVTGINVNSTLTSTQMNVVIARPLCYVPVLSAADYVERDLIMQLAAMPRIYDDTLFSLGLNANTTTCPAYGQIAIAEG